MLGTPVRRCRDTLNRGKIIRRLGRGDGHLLRGLHLIERVHEVLPFPWLAAGKAAIEVLGAVHFALLVDALRYRGK
jgi:hypothetical protein